MAVERTPDELIRNLLRERIALTQRDALRDGGQIASERIDELNRIARLADLAGKTRPPRRSRLTVALLLAVTVAVSSILLFTHVRETEIELDATVSEVGFTLSADHFLADATPLVSLGASGLSGVELPTGLPAADRTFIRLTPLEDGKHGGESTLAPLTLPAGTRVWLGSGALPEQYHLSLAAKAVRLRAGAAGAIRIEPPILTVDLASPKQFSFSGGPANVDFDLTFSPKRERLFGAHVPIHDLAMSRVEQLHEQGGTLVDRTSTVIGGSLYFSSLDDHEYKLRQGEALELLQSKGMLWRLALADGKIVLRFQGVVRGIQTGAGEGHRSLMPTYLEWARARHGLGLLWGSAVYLFGLGLAVLRWFEVQK